MGAADHKSARAFPKAMRWWNWGQAALLGLLVVLGVLLWVRNI